MVPFGRVPIPRLSTVLLPALLRLCPRSLCLFLSLIQSVIMLVLVLVLVLVLPPMFLVPLQCVCALRVVIRALLLHL